MKRSFLLTFPMAYLAFLFMWTCFGLDTQRINEPLSWSSLIISWLWRYDFHLVQTVKFQRDVQCDILVTNLDLSVFPNIFTTTKFHVHNWELTKCEIYLTCELFLPECLSSGATMISLCFQAKSMPHKYKKARYSIGNFSKKDLSNIIREFDKLP